VVLLAGADAARALTWTWPVRGPVLARFAYRAATPFARGQRRGIDIAAPAGTPALAACAGRVRFAGSVGTAGRTVSVACGRYVVSYLHLDRIVTRRGARLDAGDPVGTVGTTGGRHERRPHLSFGVRRAADRWGYVDPLRLLGRDGRRPTDLAPPARMRRTGPPLGPAPSAERRPVAESAAHRFDPTPDQGPALRAEPQGAPQASAAVPARASPSAGLPLGSLWLPAGGALALVAIAAPLGRIRRRRRHRRVTPQPVALARRATG
jgi:hypothetical protein